MGCWLKSKRGAVVLRDGVQPEDPVVRLTDQPQWFERLDASRFINDADVEIVIQTNQSKHEPVLIRLPDNIHSGLRIQQRRRR